MAMSAYLVFGLLLVGIGQIFAMSAEESKAIKALHDSCVGETGVDQRMIDECSNGNFAEDVKLKCYMKCLLTSTSVMDDGVIDVDTAIGILPEKYKEAALPILTGCGTVKGADDCDTAFQTNKCWHSMAPGN